MTRDIKAQVKRMFAGANTSTGFRSFYNFLIGSEAHRLIVLKGGPGVGKSTFIRHVADALIKSGYLVELFHCSSDPDSLDGMAVPELETAIVDGTAPHIVDPRYPGAVDEIVYLGDFWDESAIRSSRGQIIAVSKEASRMFARAYRFLRTAGDVLDDWSEANTEALDTGKANIIASQTIQSLLGSGRDASTPGQTRQLFASAITPDGFVNYLDTLVASCKDVYVVKGGPGTGKSTLLRRLADEALRRGLDIEMFHCSLNPSSVEHVIIPQIGAAVITSVEPHEWSLREQDTVVDMDSCLDSDVVSRNETITEYDRTLMNQAMDRAVHFLKFARDAHRRLESYYSPNVDFEAVAELRERTLKRIIRG